MSGKIRGQIDIGFNGATHDFEVEAPEHWHALTQDQKDEEIEQIVMNEFYNVSGSWAEYVEDKD